MGGFLLCLSLIGLDIIKPLSAFLFQHSPNLVPFFKFFLAMRGLGVLAGFDGLAEFDVLSVFDISFLETPPFDFGFRFAEVTIALLGTLWVTMYSGLAHPGHYG